MRINSHRNLAATILHFNAMACIGGISLLKNFGMGKWTGNPDILAVTKRTICGIADFFEYRETRKDLLQSFALVNTEPVHLGGCCEASWHEIAFSVTHRQLRRIHAVVSQVDLDTEPDERPPGFDPDAPVNTDSITAENLDACLRCIDYGDDDNLDEVWVWLDLEWRRFCHEHLGGIVPTEDEVRELARREDETGETDDPPPPEGSHGGAQPESPWYEESEPLSDTYNYGFIEGKLKDLASWAGYKERSFKAQNGRRFWIMFVNRYTYRVWAKDNSVYVKMLDAQKKQAE